jgi:hypothetical protein
MKGSAVPSRIAVIAIDALQPRVVADFWCDVLGWQVVDEDDTIVSIAPDDRSWPTIDVVKVPEKKTAKNPAASRPSGRRRGHG